MSFISVKNLSRKYKSINRKKGISGALANLFKPEYKMIEAVKNISFEIQKGEAVGFIGPNGAGKSTTVKMLTGILMPNEGEIKINGFIPYKERKKYTTTIGVVFGQRTQLWWDLPVADTFDLLRYVYRIEDSVFKKNMEIFNDILGLQDFFSQPVRQLSLGQRMRADLAAALIHNPPCLFLDEPTIGLDVVAKEKIRDFIRLINREHKTTILFTTHDMSDIEKTCERMIIIDRGQLIYDGSIENIKSKFGKERSLEVDFNKIYPDITFDNVKITTLNEYKKQFTFQREAVKISDLINKITNHYDVKDLTIKEPEIEGIIRHIYESGVHDV